MRGGDCVELPEELQRLVEKRLVPEVINGQNMSGQLFVPPFFSSTDFRVALGRMCISQKMMLADVSCPPFIM